MRFIIMHKTSAHWEAGGVPGSGLVKRVGALLAEIAADQALLGADGLRPSAEGVRLTFVGGARTISSGPFPRGNELPAGFDVVRTSSMDDAIEWATRLAASLGDVEIDIRPVTEPWDIGITDKPSDIFTRRYMILRKATAATEAGERLTAAREAEIARLIDESTRSGLHLASERMAPSKRGRRYKNSGNQVVISDGPFIETKELIGGYIIVGAETLDDASRWALRYLETVPTDEVDVRELE
jgi:hypothetical protein